VVHSKVLNKPFDLSRLKTHEDVWTVVETELEYPRRGHYDRVFPSMEGTQYLKYLSNKERNTMIVDWVEAGMSLDDIRAPTP
jgi:hypothetical protein